METLASTLTTLTLTVLSVLSFIAEESLVVPRKSSTTTDVPVVDVADAPLIPLPEVARKEGTTKGIVIKACQTLGIAPRRTASGRDHLSFNQTLQVIEHLRRAAQPS